MNHDYDVIIIGGGLAGLSSGSILAKEGLKVRLFERHSQPGGYATTFFRDRFEFEVALHELSGIGTAANPGPLRHLFDALGLLEKLSFIQTPVLYRAIAPGLDTIVPSGVDDARELLTRAFPRERTGIESIIGRAIAISRDVNIVKASGNRPSPARALSLYPNLAHAAGVPLSDVLYREIRDPAARLALGQLWGYFGLPPTQLSFLLYAVAFNSYLQFGGCLIREKSQALAHALVEVIQKAGSEVSLSHGVSRIVVKNGAVQGVVTDRGDELTAPTIISNISPQVTCNDLIAPSLIDKGYHARLNFGRPSLSSVSVFLGLSRPSREIGIEHHEMYLNQTIDMEEQYAACLDIAPPKCMGICAYDVNNPDFSPAGSGVVTLVTLSDGAAWKNIAPAEYPQIKMKLAKDMLAQAEVLFPDLGSIIETAVVSTPITNMRYTGNPYGAIYGFANTPEHNPGFRLNNEGPLTGLWFAGAWTQPSAGYQGVISSGYKVADAILLDRGAERVVPREMDIAKRILDQSAPTATASCGRVKGYRTLLHDIKRVGRTVRTKYKIPESPPQPDICAESRVMTRRYHAERQPMRVIGKTEQGPNTVTLKLEPVEGTVPPFYAGQYFNVFVETNGVLASRPYSISSRPGPTDSIEFTVKKRDTGFVSGRLVDDAGTGDIVALTGPVGEFFYNPLRDTDELIGLAVGSGITPFLSIIEDFAARPRPIRMTLIYGSRLASDIIFRSQLEQLARDHDWLDVVFSLSRPQQDWTGESGRIDRELIHRHLANQNLERKTFFVCGPRELYRDILIALGDLGVQRRRIRLESYGPPEDVTQERLWPEHIKKNTGFKVRIKGRDGFLLAPAGEPLLSTFERAGLHRPSLCRSDVCDSCRMRLIEGEVFYPDDILRQRTGHQEFIHLCMTYPLGDVVLSD